VEWLAAHLERRLGVDRERITLDASFEELGLDSADAVEVAGALGSLLGRDLPETLLYDHSSIARLAAHLSDEDTGAARERPAAVSRHRPAASEKAGAIAVIGLGCRFPGASGPDEYWALLSEGRSSVGELPEGRFGPDQDELIRTRARTAAPRYGAFLDGVTDFDAEFFRISPREAVAIDPQQRLLLEVCQEALEDACEPPGGLAGTSTGVFVGTGASDYSHLLLRMPELPEGYAATGTAPSAAAGRLSYAFDLRGPSVALDAACATSLFAVHLACQSLRAGECDTAIAGGANALLMAEPSLVLDRLGMLAPDGRCKAFDARGDGYVRGEGAGVVVLKPLDDAYRDGNPVYGLIRGSAANADGRTNGLSAPSAESQESVVGHALARAGVRAHEIRYVETQGTGTRLGDAVEASALTAAVGRGRSVGRRCAIGSVKTNLGHLEAAAGAASLAKVLLALCRRALPPTLNFEVPNPVLQARACALRVQDGLDSWPRGPGRNVAGVSAFGFSGTNVHVVVEEAPDGLAPAVAAA
jgi:phthiocerol/phenolphthiocerol synthesis type-I polyketide synthase C